MNYRNDVEKGFHKVFDIIKRLIQEGNPVSKNGYLHLCGEMLSFYRRYWEISLDQSYESLLALLAEPADLLIVAAIDAESRSLGKAALALATASAQLNPHPQYKLVAAEYERKYGTLAKARQLCTESINQHPGNMIAESELFSCDMAEKLWSRDYYDILAELHSTWQPKVYLEIGVATGKSLALTRAGTRTIGIDPDTAEIERLFYHSPEQTPQLYRMTSDDFFETVNVPQAMAQPCFNVAFIDGLHLFDQVLLDFINLEKFAGSDSVIFIHDCLPINAHVATRNRNTAFWTGDVWKVIPCLKSIRPDLEIITLPVAPSGLALIRKLDPRSQILERHFDSLVQHFNTLKLPDIWEERASLLNVFDQQNSFRLSHYMPERGWL